MQIVSKGWRVAGRGAALACALIAGGLAGPALADDDDTGAGAEKPRSYPYLKGSVSVEIEHDNTFDADDAGAEGSDTYTTTEMELGAYLSPFFSLHGHFTLEPVEDRAPGDDRVFEDHGLYAEQLYARFTFGEANLDIGKIHPHFGVAWDETPGIYGTDMAEDYELVEKVGLGLSVSRKNTAVGDVTLHAATFFADTSFLSRSVFTDRGRTSRSDGGLSNTQSLESFSVSLEGSELPGLAGVSYNIGFVHQAGGAGDLDDQNGVVFGLKSKHTYNNVEFEWIGETAWFDYGGDLYDTDDEAAYVDKLWYYTLGAQATFNDKYRINAAFTSRQAELYNGTDFDDFQYTASAGMKIWRDWWLDVGYAFVREEDEDSQTVGLLLSKTFDFERSALEPMKP